MITGSALYDRVLTLIDYCGDIRGKRENYSQKFSPNNIRRLYISPDGAIVTYHINAGTGLVKPVSFQPEVVLGCMSMPDYKPMLHVLSADRVCASVEEVVICTASDNGACIDQRELDFNGLIKSYKGGGRDVKDVIMNRFKRLHAFIIFPGTANELMRLTKDCASPMRTLTSVDALKSCSIEYFHKDDWYKNYGSSGQFYALDMAGSPLNNHFVRVKKEVEAQSKAKDLDNFKAERTRGLEGDFLKAYEQCCQIIKCYTKLVKLSQRHGESGLGVSLPSHKFLMLKKCNVLSGKQPSLVSISEGTGSQKEILEYNKQECQRYAKEFYVELVSGLLNGLAEVNSKYPVMTKVIMSGIDRAISVPPQLESINSQLPVQLKGKRYADSVANLSVLLGVLCIAEFNATDKEVWMKCMN